MAENTTPDGDRIAKVLSRRGVSSRREAERLIEAGEVKVNGKIITSPALNVTDADKITISGHPLPALEPARLWLYYKPEGLVTSASDEKGRDTVFDHLPADMPRVMSIGRLDLNSEGLLLLTNDGELKRRLELPSTGWLRKYRVRIKGNPTDPELEPLRKGVEVDGEKFQPMSVVLDRHQGANAWLTVGLREGKNREIRRAINSIGLIVNRLIRVSYGPFRLNELQPGDVEEVKARVLREQLGSGATDDGTEPAARKPRPATGPATRRVRPGDAVKALARAWDEATTPQPDAPRRTATTKTAPRSEDDTRQTAPARRPPAPPKRDREATDAPRRAAPKPTRDRDEDAPRRSASPKPRPRDEARTRAETQPRTRSDDARKGYEERPRKASDETRKSYEARPRPRSDEARKGNDEPPRRPLPKGARPADDAAPRRSVTTKSVTRARDDEKAPRRAPMSKSAKPAAPTGTGRKIAGPRPSTARPGGPKPAGSPAGKPPSKPRKG